MLGLDLETRVGELADQLRIDLSVFPSAVRRARIKTPLQSFIASLKSREDLQIAKQFTIKAVPELPGGKWPRAVFNAGFVESHFLFRDLLNTLIDKHYDTFFRNMGLDLLDEFLVEGIKFNLLLEVGSYDYDQYALQSNIVLKDRMRLYTTDKSVPVLETLSRLVQSNTALVQKAFLMAPLYLGIQQFENMYNIMINVEVCTISLLVVLSALIIYTLMTSDVTERLYELGLMRMVGMAKTQVVVVLELSAFSFTVPGTLFGMALSQVYLFLAPVLLMFIAFYRFEFSLSVIGTFAIVSQPITPRSQSWPSSFLSQRTWSP